MTLEDIYKQLNEAWPHSVTLQVSGRKEERKEKSKARLRQERWDIL